MNNVSSSTKFVSTSGTGVIGVASKPVNLQGVYNGSASGQGIAFYSGVAAVTMAWVTMPARLYTTFPMAGPGGITYQTIGNAGDADLKLVFFFEPGTST